MRPTFNLITVGHKIFKALYDYFLKMRLLRYVSSSQIGLRKRKQDHDLK